MATPFERMSAAERIRYVPDLRDRVAREPEAAARGPERPAPGNGPARRVPVWRTPVGVFYRVRDQALVVLVAAHA